MPPRKVFSKKDLLLKRVTTPKSPIEKITYCWVIVAVLGLLWGGCEKPNPTSPDPKERARAAKKTTDQILLAKMATEDKDEEVRVAALLNLTDQTVLAKVVAESGNERERGVAVRNITDGAILARIALSDKNRDLRTSAVCGLINLKNQEFLAKVAIEDPYGSNARFAIDSGRLTDQILLSKVAREAISSESRAAAATKLKDPVLLTKLALEDKEGGTANFVAQLKDEATLSKLAVEAAAPAVRAAAAERLTDRALLAKIAVEDKNSSVRDAANTKWMEVDEKAVEPRIACLRLYHQRRRAAASLGKLGDRRAIGPLVAALPDWGANAEIGTALDQLGWRPSSDRENVYFWICLRSDKAKKNWHTTRAILAPDMKSENEKKRLNAVNAFITLGNDAIVPEMIAVLNASGDSTMASIYLNSGNQALHDAGVAWAKEHGYTITTFKSSGPSAVWARW
ncbi:MAG: hypothetical protein LLG01_12650 [Planctomycetaceae bacterium]|nr:hypothetical protein [Planctomycetaceae bacterium]